MPKLRRQRDNSDQAIFDLKTDQLDDHWIEQPRLMFEYMEKLADARRDVDEAKTALDLVVSEIALDIRTNPESYELEKVTEKSVSELTLIQDQYKEAQKAVADAKHRQDVLQAFVTALDHRKKALEKLVDLHGQSYFATPVAKGGTSEEFNEQQKRKVRTRGQK